MEQPRTAGQWVSVGIETPDDQSYSRYLNSLPPSWFSAAEEGAIVPPRGRLATGKPRSGLWILDQTPVRPSQLDLPPGLLVEIDTPSTLETLDDNGVLTHRVRSVVC